MDIFLFILQILLVGVLLTAAVSKLLNLDKTRLAIFDFGVPIPLVRPTSILLPLIEFFIGILLLPFCLPWYGAMWATLLFCLFTLLILYHLINGAKFNCNCFGEVRIQPIGWQTIIRNSVFILMAACIVILGASTINDKVTSWLITLPIDRGVDLLLSLLIISLLIVGGRYVIKLVKSQQHLLLKVKQLEGQLVNIPKPKGLPVGVDAPYFSLLSTSKKEVDLKMLLEPQLALVLFFTHPDCGPCSAFLPKIVDWKNRYGDKFNIALITTTSTKSNAFPPEYELLTTLIEHERSVSKAYQVNSIPSALLIKPDGIIGTPLAGGGDAINNLIQWLVNEK